MLLERGKMKQNNYQALKVFATPEIMRNLYNFRQFSMGEIAQMYNVSRTAVYKYMKLNNIESRSKSIARRIATKKQKFPRYIHKINDSFFSNWSNEMAWVLGMLYSDGNLNKKGYISISSIDKEVLNKLKTCLSSSHPISKVKQNNKLYTFVFCCVKIYDDLIELGLHPKKAKTIKYPDIPEKFESHFIRGLFDGDGSIYNEKKSNYPLRASYSSSSEEFIYSLEKRLNNAGLKKRNIYKGINYYFRYGYAEAVKLSEYLYSGDCDHIRLERKYLKFNLCPGVFIVNLPGRD